MDLNEAMRHLDLKFGDGYGEEHPDQVINYMQTYLLGGLKNQIIAGTDELRKSIDDLNEKIGDLEAKLTQSN